MTVKDLIYTLQSLPEESEIEFFHLKQEYSDEETGVLQIKVFVDKKLLCMHFQQFDKDEADAD